MYLSAGLNIQVFQSEPMGCSAPQPAVVEDEPREGTNLLRRSGEGSEYRLINVSPEGLMPGAAHFQAASAYMSHVIFTENAPLVQGAPSGEDLYDWNEGTVRLVTYLPDGVPVAGSLAAGYSGVPPTFGVSPAGLARSVSSDGEIVVFTAEGSLYGRVNAGQVASKVSGGEVNGEQCIEAGKACTIQLDAGQGGSEAGGGGIFWGASSDGSHIFFTDESDLTPDATAASGAPDLYEYDLEDGKLTDLTVASASEPANVQGVVGVSEDGSHVYFVAKGVLAGATHGTGPTRRKRNLYVRHAGTTEFVATLGVRDSGDWASGEFFGQDFALRTSLTSPTGRWLAFQSVQPLTGYNCSECDEIFLYDATASALHCVSCGHPGSRLEGARLEKPAGIEPRRQLMSDGRMFFETAAPLLEQDSNGASDVYEWAPVGVNECQQASSGYNAQSEGCLQLISSGISPEPSFFADASENGSDVFFTTAQALLGNDTDNEASLYDARVEGGFPGIGATVVEPPSCEEEACRPPAAEPPVEAFGASSAFNGPGDLAPGETKLKAPTATHGKGKHTLGRRQKLKRALSSCAKKPKRKRRRCRTRARTRFGKAHARRHRRRANARKSDRRHHHGLGRRGR